MSNEFYKVIIVDDEKSIRESLSKFVNWNLLGFEVVGCFGNGMQALAYLENNRTDVILTDIRMPQMTGLDIARFFHENKKNIKIVFLTGYKDFEYAKQAIEFGVVHYLLKPTQLPELYEVFSKIKSQLDQEIDQMQNLNSLKQALREQFFVDVVLGALKSREDIEKRIALLNLNINIERNRCVVLSLEIKNYETYMSEVFKFGKDQLYVAIQNFLSMKYDEIEFISVYRSEGIIKYIANSECPMDYLEKSISDIAVEIQDTYKLELAILIEGIYDNIYSLAAHSADHTHMNNIKTQNDLVNLKHLIEQQKLLMTHVVSGDEEMVETLFKTIMMTIDVVEIEVQRNFIQYLFNFIDKKLFDKGLDYVIEDFEMSNEVINSFQDNKAIYEWGISKLRAIIKNIKSNVHNSENIVINNARKYINENYYKDISLEDVANYVFLSPAYFSRIFKKHCDENFSEYLLKIRMKKAAVLLQTTQLKVYEIAEKVGIKTLKYFYRLFKQYSGVTPSEYRLSVIENMENDNNG